MNDYRVKVNSWVVVRARNASDAKAKAELSLRRAVAVAYLKDDNHFTIPWELYGWEATGKPERVDDEE